ncbi:MAG: metallophosphoesterase [Clostridia bacterium]|nr:metallophosphoesterase [Clostridia bacterium]
MKIYAIGDLHLPGGDAKPMDVFGPQWERHFERIAQDWRGRVAEQDIVLIPGDISWAMRQQEAEPDLLAIGVLPGRKILLRGNHDYWWSAIGRVRAALPVGMYALQNDALVLDGQVFCGARGWTCLGEEPQNPDDARIYAREILRMRMSLETARRIAPELPLTALMHFPPDPSFLSLAEEFGAVRLVYGHLHGAGLRNALCGKWGGSGMYIHQVSCDGLGFRLLDLEEKERV